MPLDPRSTLPPAPSDPVNAKRFARILEPGAALSEQIAVLEAIGADLTDARCLAECAAVLRQRGRRMARVPENAIDLCGTGGDRSRTFNISTVAAFVVAGAGIPVAKHGNGSVSSNCGSSDCLRELGIDAAMQAHQPERWIRDAGIAFLFAPLFHPAIARVMQARRVLAQRGRRTIFNLLGPLANPAGVTRHAMGVYSPELIEPMAGALLALGARRALVYHGDGLDEITLTGPTRFAAVDAGRIEHGTLHASALGFQSCRLEDLAGGTPRDNARIARGILEGRLRGPRRDVVLLNAAAAIQVGLLRRRPLCECLDLAVDSIESGSALEKLDLLIEGSKSCKTC